MKTLNTKPKVKLIGTDGNALSLVSKVKCALKHAGADREYINKFQKEALSGDYNNVLQTCMDYVEVI